MPETTENYHRVPNPAYSEGDFTDKVRTAVLSEKKWIKALWSPLVKGGQWKVRTFLFDRDKWPMMSSCQSWVKQHEGQFTEAAPRSAMFLAAGEETAFVDLAERADGQPTEDELDIINQYALRPLAADEVYVRTMRLTNTAWGKHFLRLSPEFQSSYLQDLPGKSLLLGHPQSKGVPAEPLGVWFATREERDETTGVTSGLAKFYMVRTAHNEHARAQIDGGVWRYGSAGMELDWVQCSLCGKDLYAADCKHVPGQRYPKKQANAAFEPQACEDATDMVYCGATMRGRGRALEGSIVYLSELNGTQIIAESGDGLVEQMIGYKTCILTADDAGAMDDTTGTERSKQDMPTPEELQAQLDEAGAKVTTLETKSAELQDALAAEKTKTGLLEKQAGNEVVFRAASVKELERLAGLLKREAEFAVYKDLAGDDLADMSAEKLLALQAQWQATLDAQTPPQRQSTSTMRDPGDGHPEGGKQRADLEAGGPVEVRALALA